MTRVAVLDDWQGAAEGSADWSAVRARAEIVFFREAYGTPEALSRAIAGFDVVVAMRERSSLLAPTVSLLKDLRFLVFTGVTNASVDIDACTRQGITVCNTGAGRPSPATAELTLGLILAVARSIPLGDAEMRAGRFQERTKPGIELHGKTLGVVGLGRIGANVSRYCQALGMNVIAWSTNLTAARAHEVGATLVTKADLFAQADVITLHVVLSDRTRGIIGAEDIGRMKPGALLINTSRSPLIDQTALLTALEGRRIHAGIDVYETEPLPADHPLRSAPNTVLTPHIGYVVREGISHMYGQCVENIMAWLDGKPINVLTS